MKELSKEGTKEEREGGRKEEEGRKRKEEEGRKRRGGKKDEPSSSSLPNEGGNGREEGKE